ncbi:DNA double-strand break repair nuclease NurA [Thermococcus sp.]
MSKFYDLFAKELRSKRDKWKERYHSLPNTLEKFLREEFNKLWKPVNLKDYERNPKEFNILAVDSSYQAESLKNGGIFYAVRALGISKDKEYRDLIVDFDYADGPVHNVTHFLQRKMEYLELKVAADAISDGFNGTILIDGSLYGRISHLIEESPMSNDRGFFIEYYKEVMRLFKLAKKNEVLLVGISKESRSRFFRDFLVKNLVSLGEIRGDVQLNEVFHLLSLALDQKKKAIKMLDSLKRQYENIGLLDEVLKELLTPRPDYQLIDKFAQQPGYTIPLLLGPSARWLRGIEQIEKNPEGYIESHFPTLFSDPNFVSYAKVILKNIPDLPSIISMHVLPDVNDSPLRIDIPAFCLGDDVKLKEIGWPEPFTGTLDQIFEIIATGYGGLEFYNIWLWKVDREVKFHRHEFDELYFSKFKEAIGVEINARDYRRVRIL